MDDNFNLMVFSGRDNLPEFLATAKELEVKGLMEANDGPTENDEQESPVKEVDESIGASALEPQMEIRENGSDDENTNDKLVVNVQGSDWGEEDYSYSGAAREVLSMKSKCCIWNISGGSSQPPRDQDCVKPDFKSGSIFNMSSLTTPSKSSGDSGHR